MLKRERRGGGGGRGTLINIFARKRVVGVTMNRSLFETGVLIGTISRKRYFSQENTYNKALLSRHFHLHSRHLRRRPTSYEYTPCCHKQRFVRDSVGLDNLQNRSIIKKKVSTIRTVLQ